jgi:hypothetical protein
VRREPAVHARCRLVRSSLTRAHHIR